MRGRPPAAVAERDAPTRSRNEKEPRQTIRTSASCQARLPGDHGARRQGSAERNVTSLAAAVAYYTFLAIPFSLLVAVGAFSLFAGPNAVHTIMSHLSTVMPTSAASCSETA